MSICNARIGAENFDVFYAIVLSLRVAPAACKRFQTCLSDLMWKLLVFWEMVAYDRWFGGSTIFSNVSSFCVSPACNFQVSEPGALDRK